MGGLNFRLRNFDFTLSNLGKTCKLTAERTGIDDSIERWRIYNKQNPDAAIMLSNNRPLLHRKFLFKKRWEWKVQGKVRYQSVIDQAINYIEYYINHQWQPPKKGAAKKV